MTDRDTFITNVKDFLDRNSPVIKRDRDDLKLSRGIRSGFGFSQTDKDLRGVNRAEITLNLLKPWINSVVGNYSINPYTISVERYDGGDSSNINEIMDYVQSKCDITELSTNILESIMDDGYAYVLVANEVDNPQTNSQYPKPTLLDPDRLYMDYCEDKTGEDCDMAVYISLIKKSKAKKLYNINDYTLRETDVFADYTSNDDTKYYTTVATVYERVPQGVTVTKICHGVLVEEPVLLSGFTRIPIVRIVGERVYLDSLKTERYRGAYWLVYDLLRTANFQMSKHAEIMATSPTPKMLLDGRTIDGKREYWQQINRSPMAYVEYNAIDESGNPLPKPEVFPKDESDGVSLLGGVKELTAMVNTILGTPTSDPINNETEVSVLLRKSINEANSNRYIKNLCEGMEAIGDVILMWLPLLFDVTRTYNNKILQAISDTTPYYTVVTKGPIEANQKDKIVVQLMAIENMIAKNPTSKILPSIIKNVDMPDETKAEILGIISGNNVPVVDPAMQQALAQKDLQLQQSNALVVELQKNVAMLQQSLFEMTNDSKAKILDTQLRIASDERIAMAKLQWEREKYIMDTQAKGIKANIEVSEADKDRQLESELAAQKTMLELEKERNKTREMAEQIDVPLFTNSKFT